MPQSLSSILVHLVFSTKNREPFITPQIESELHPYMATIFREHNSLGSFPGALPQAFACCAFGALKPLAPPPPIIFRALVACLL